MYIVSVIPIQKSKGRDNLSYFHPTEIPLGTIVSVPVRNKNINAIVISNEKALDLKSDIKKADFKLKKIDSIRGPSPFSIAFFESCMRLAEYTASNTGIIIKNLLPNIFLENIKSLKKNIQENQSEKDLKIKSEKLIFQALNRDRYSFYKTLIREAFAKRESIYMCVPTRYDIEQFLDIFSKGIESYVYAFHSEMPKRTIINNYNKIIGEEHPILIIGTGSFLSIPRQDIKTIIIEKESSDAYKQYGRPYADIRTFAEIFASLSKSKLILSDTLLRPETLERNNLGEFGEVASPLFRLPKTEREIIVDMREEIDEKGNKKFSVLGDTTIKMIRYAIEHNENVFLFANRKGLAPVTVCNDCGNTLLCPHCSTPIVLYGSKQRTATKNTTPRVFMCNKCGKKETTETRCNKCGSWNLTPLGIGTDRVHDEIKNIFPNAKIIQIDKEQTPKDKDCRIAIEEFNRSKGSILIGTELAFSYIREEITHSAIISLDGLLSIPNFNITQKILHIIEKLHYITIRNLIIQTRLPDNPILEHILSGNVLPLYREDLNERKIYGYPPYKRLIKITFTGTKPETEKARHFIDENLEEYEPQIFSAFVGKIKGQYITNTVVKISPKDWKVPTSENIEINQNLKNILKSLPPSFSVDIDPEDLL